jgi:hypothetical protein
VPSATRRNRLAHLAKLLRVPALMQRPFQGQKAPRFTPAQERFDFVKRVVWTFFERDEMGRRRAHAWEMARQ